MDTKTNRKPIEVKRGNVIVKIYQGNNRVNGVNYPQFTLTYYEGAERKKRRFADLAEARREADFTAEKLSKGEGQVLHLTSVDRTIYVQAIEHLRPLNVPLNVAVLEYASAVKQLPQGATLKEAVDFFRKRNPASLEKRTVRQVADEMLAAKRAANLSAEVGMQQRVQRARTVMHERGGHQVAGGSVLLVAVLPHPRSGESFQFTERNLCGLLMCFNQSLVI
jgi:hypothetical protein